MRAKPDVFSTRLNVASNRLSDGTWVSNTVANAQTGRLGWTANEAGKRSEAVPAGPRAKHESVASGGD